MSEDVVDQPPPPSGEDWPARIEQLLGEAEAAPSPGERATGTRVLSNVSST